MSKVPGFCASTRAKEREITFCSLLHFMMFSSVLFSSCPVSLLPSSPLLLARLALVRAASRGGIFSSQHAPHGGTGGLHRHRDRAHRPTSAVKLEDTSSVPRREGRWASPRPTLGLEAAAGGGDALVDGEPLHLGRPCHDGQDDLSGRPS